MEEDQKLFDICTQNYNKQREAEQEKQLIKQKQWETLEKVASEQNCVTTSTLKNYHSQTNGKLHVIGDGS